MRMRRGPLPALRLSLPSSLSLVLHRADWMTVSSSVAVPVVVVTALLIAALASAGVLLFVRRHRRLARETARPFSAGPEAACVVLQRPSFINVMPATAVLTAPISPSVASGFQTRAPAPHRQGSLYASCTPAASVRSDPFSDGYRPASASTSVSDVSTVRSAVARARSPTGSRAPSRAPSMSTVQTARSELRPLPVPPPPEHPFSPDFRPAPALPNPVVLRVRTSVAPPAFSLASAIPESATPTAKTKKFALTPAERDRDAADPPPSYTPRSGVSAFAISRSALGHARSPSAATWDSDDEL